MQPKCEVIQKIAMNNSIAVILLQETHATNDDKIMIYGYSLIGSINHPKHGIGTLVRNDLPATEIDRSRVDSEIQCLTISIDEEITITNFYKHQILPLILRLNTNILQCQLSPYNLGPLQRQP